MKKTIFIFSLLFTAVVTAWAVVSVGKFVQFPDGSLMGSAYKPNLYFCTMESEKIGEITLLGLKMTRQTGYCKFDENSRILIRFADSTKITLHRAIEFPVNEKYTNSYIQNYGIAHYYSTFTDYEIDDETIAKITTTPILKIRVVVNDNGEVFDYDIKPKYAQKLMQGLSESYKETKAENEKRKENNNDDNF